MSRSDADVPEIEFCVAGGLLTSGPCRSKRNVLAESAMRVRITAHLDYARVSKRSRGHEQATCGPATTTFVDGQRAWKSSQVQFAQTGSVDAVVLLDLVDGTHRARVEVVASGCDSGKERVLVGDIGLECSKIKDVAAVVLKPSAIFAIGG